MVYSHLLHVCYYRSETYQQIQNEKWKQTLRLRSTDCNSALTINKITTVSPVKIFWALARWNKSPIKERSPKKTSEMATRSVGSNSTCVPSPADSRGNQMSTDCLLSTKQVVNSYILLLESYWMIAKEHFVIWNLKMRSLMKKSDNLQWR